MPFPIDIFSQEASAFIYNSYTMVCPPVPGDNPRALPGGLCLVKAEKYCCFIPPFISIDLSSCEIFRVKMESCGRCGIIFILFHST